MSQDISLTSIARVIAEELMGHSMTENITPKSAKEPYQAIFKLGRDGVIPDAQIFATEHMFFSDKGTINVTELDEDGDEMYVMFLNRVGEGDLFSFSRELSDEEIAAIVRADLRLSGHLTGAMLRRLEIIPGLDYELNAAVTSNILESLKTDNLPAGVEFAASPF